MKPKYYFTRKQWIVLAILIAFGLSLHLANYIFDLLITTPAK